MGDERERRQKEEVIPLIHTLYWEKTATNMVGVIVESKDRHAC